MEDKSDPIYEAERGPFIRMIRKIWAELTEVDVFIFTSHLWKADSFDIHLSPIEKEACVNEGRDFMEMLLFQLLEFRSAQKDELDAQNQKIEQEGSTVTKKLADSEAGGWETALAAATLLGQEE